MVTRQRVALKSGPVSWNLYSGLSLMVSVLDGPSTEGYETQLTAGRASPNFSRTASFQAN